ncbi:MAG: hypothetical protein R3D85_09480 [Paracoccaceae bacterium]
MVDPRPKTSDAALTRKASAEVERDRDHPERHDAPADFILEPGLDADLQRHADIGAGKAHHRRDPEGHVERGRESKRGGAGEAQRNHPEAHCRHPRQARPGGDLGQRGDQRPGAHGRGQEAQPFGAAFELAVGDQRENLGDGADRAHGDDGQQQAAADRPAAPAFAQAFQEVGQVSGGSGARRHVARGERGADQQVRDEQQDRDHGGGHGAELADHEAADGRADHAPDIEVQRRHGDDRADQRRIDQARAQRLPHRVIGGDDDAEEKRDADERMWGQPPGQHQGQKRRRAGDQPPGDPAIGPQDRRAVGQRAEEGRGEGHGRQAERGDEADEAGRARGVPGEPGEQNAEDPVAVHAQHGAKEVAAEGGAGEGGAGGLADAGGHCGSSSARD